MLLNPPSSSWPPSPFAQNPCRKSKSKSATPTATSKAKGKAKASQPSEPPTDDDDDAANEDEQALGNRLSLQATFDVLTQAIAENPGAGADDNENEGEEEEVQIMDGDDDDEDSDEDSNKENDADVEENKEEENDPFADDIMAISSPKKKNSSKRSGKKTGAVTSKPSADVVAVSGDGNPFRNGAHTLSRAAWNRLRIFIQLVNGFPKPEEHLTIPADLIKDLVLGVRTYAVSWTKLSVDHRHLMVTHTWKAVAQVRGEWKHTALPLVKDYYFKDLLLPEQWKERQVLAKWLLGENEDKADVFVFGGIEYSEESKVWDWQAPYLNLAFRGLIKGQAFEYGKNPDAFRNLEEFKSFTFPFLAITATALENCIRGYVDTGIYKNILFNDRYNSKRYQYHLNHLEYAEEESDDFILWSYEKIYEDIMKELDLGYLTANPSDVKDKTNYAALRNVPRNRQPVNAHANANDAPQAHEPQAEGGGVPAANAEAGPSGS